MWNTSDNHGNEYLIILLVFPAHLIAKLYNEK
jgi:hypothetical protein